MGSPPAAFIDNDPCLQGGRIEGIDVLAPQAALLRFGITGVFIVTVYNGSAVRAQLEALGCAYVLHVESLLHGWPDVFLPYYQIDSPITVFDASDEILAVEPMWSDALSLSAYHELILRRIGLSTDVCIKPLPVDRVYFDPAIYALSANDTIVDCGAYDGDTIRRLDALDSPKVRRVVALEPDPANARALREFRGGLPAAEQSRIVVHAIAASDFCGTITFDASGDVAARVGDGDMEVAAVTLDALFADEDPPTVIKMDVEGHELAALRGAAGLLREHAPVLAISLYHRAEDLWRIPAFISRTNPAYRLYLRCYAEDGWESVCYAVPPIRDVDE